MTYLLRVVLPDRPGALGALATALGLEEIDILSMDVVEQGHGIAVDDLLVDLPTSRPPDVLITAAESVDGVSVEALRPFSGPLDTARELELLEEVSAAPADAPRLVADAFPRVYRAAWALVLEGDGGPGAVRRLAASAAAPETDADELAWLPPARAVALDTGPDGQHAVPRAWTELDTELAASPLRADRLVIVGRPGGPGFRPSELARMSHLCGILGVAAGS